MNVHDICKTLSVTYIKDLTSGVNKKVALVKYSGKNAVLKYDYVDSIEIDVEHIGQEFGPKIIETHSNFILEEFVVGKPIQEHDLSSFHQAGKQLKKIHTYTHNLFGRATNPTATTWPNAIYEWYNKIPQETKQLVTPQLDCFLDKLHTEQATLIHGDLDIGHILVNKNVTLIDFGSMAYANKWFDFCLLFLRYGNSPQLDTILRGYGEIDMKQIKLNTLVRLMWKINVRKKQGKPFQKYINRYQQFAQELN